MKAPAPGVHPGRAVERSEQSNSTALGTDKPASRPIYALRLEPLPGIDGARALRDLLKRARRNHGLRCIACVEEAGAMSGLADSDSEVRFILDAAERATPRPDLDEVEWGGEFEPDLDEEAWLAIRTRPSPAVVAELRRRFGPDDLAELAEDPCAWNITCAAIEAGPALLDMHRGDPPPIEEKPRRYIDAAMRREAAEVLRAPPAERPMAIDRARDSLQRFVLAGLTVHELDRFISGLEGAANG